MTTEQWPEAIGLGPLYRRTSQLPELIEKFPREQPMCEGSAGSDAACGYAQPHHGHFLDSEPYENWQDDEGQLYRDGAELLGVDQEEDHPEECGCPECREDADRDTADEHDYDRELWADADASREGEGL